MPSGYGSAWLRSFEPESGRPWPDGTALVMAARLSSNVLARSTQQGISTSTRGLSADRSMTQLTADVISDLGLSRICRILKRVSG
jgi:hypothetical protein